jgi:hypothetical protein
VHPLLLAHLACVSSGRFVALPHSLDTKSRRRSEGQTRADTREFVILSCAHVEVFSTA